MQPTITFLLLNDGMMKKWEENESIRENYSKLRNKNEYFNSFIKQHAGFETDIPRKGRDSAFFHTTLCLLSLNFVALTKLQNGVTENLIRFKNCKSVSADSIILSVEKNIYALLILILMRLISIEEVDETLEAWKKRKEGKKRGKEEYQQKE